MAEKRFETLLDQAKAWLHALSGASHCDDKQPDGWKLASELSAGIVDLLGEDQPCGWSELFVSDGLIAVSPVGPCLNASEARAFAAMLLRAADEAEG